jgi:ppGpp synthetase/RelA/SpoT-type nucleotidyltranferase
VITPAQIRNKYRSVENYFQPLQKLVRDPLLVYCESHEYAVVSRIKSLDSVAEKVESGRYSRWSELDDLVAFAVVIPTLAEEPAVIAFLRDTFEEVVLRSRGTTQKPPDVFRFDCTRFIGRLRASSQVEAAPAYQIMFEVQVRSAFEHAWQVATHALTYKSDDVGWNKLRLSAQLKAAVEQLDLLVLAFEGASGSVQPSLWPDVQAREEIKAYFSDAVQTGRIPVELAPRTWSRFADNVLRLVRSGQRGIRPHDIPALVRNAVDGELMDLGPDKIPRSLSLWQFTFASLFKAGTLATTKDSWPLITPELEDLYPAVRSIQPRFDYS